MTKRNDPGTYRKCSEPFLDGVVANVALQAFFTDVAAAREKHRIADVIVLCEVSHGLDGEEVRGSASLKLGDSFHALAIIAREYGRAHQEHEDNLALLMARARKST